MEQKSILTIIRGIVNGLKKTVLTIQGKVDVDFPETQKVEITNQLPIVESVQVSNLDEVVKVLQSSVGEVSKILSKPQAKPEEIKPSLIKGLAAVKKAVESIKLPENKDLSSKFDEVVSAIDKIDTSVDYSVITQGLDNVVNTLEALREFTRFDEVKVYINEKQLEKLSKSVSVAVGGAQQQSFVKRVDDGGSDATDGAADKTYTAEYDDTISPGTPQGGQKIHIVGDGDKFIVSNVTEGATIGTRDGIPVAGEDGSGKKRPVLLDDLSGALTTVDFAHHEIHDGDSFWYDDVVTGAAAVNYLITTPDTTKWSHFGYDVESSAAGYTLEMYEATNKGGTTAQTVYDRNRNTANTATTTIHKGLTGGDSDGTRIMWHVTGTTTAGGKVGGSSKDATERILKRATKYILRITPLASNTFSLRINWYEHTDKY